MVKLELLAPARNLECGKAAIDHGADAVYIGAERFGARVAVGNSIDDIAELCSYAHTYGAKVFVTVNTIIYDNEIDATRQLLIDLNRIGVDAVLVQDMALMEIADELKSENDSVPFRLAMHASTQTDNRTAEKVAWLKQIGFSRAVLARELSADEIAAVHKSVPDIELEVFVHGALCVSYSGICYASQYCFNRSANRGECAQFCRLKFDLIDSEGRVLVHDRYLLSLKDMSQYDNLERLIEAGATSFKIEGRLKDVNYVKNVTAAYSQQLDRIVKRHPDKYCRASMGHCTYTFTPNLSKTFNRGYTSYFINGRQPDISSPDTPKALGEYVGKVKEVRGNSFNVAGIASFANGDGLCYINKNRELEGFRVNRVEGNRLFPLKMPRGIHSGQALYRNNDQEFDRILSKPSSVRKIGISMRLNVTDEGFSVDAWIAGSKGTVTANITSEHQKANTPQRDNIVLQLSKLGNTVYECTDVRIPDGFNYFIPSSMLASFRRDIVERLGEILKSDDKRIMPTSQNDAGQIPHLYQSRPSYLYNISNRLAHDFYKVHGLSDIGSAFEKSQPKSGILMQCRYCIRYALGYCVKHGGAKPTWNEPLYLQMSDGRRFRLEFECRSCQMNVCYDS